MVASDVVHARRADERPDLRRRQVRQLVLVCGRQVRDQAAVVARNDDAAAAGWQRGIDQVFDVQAGGLACVVECVGSGVGADAADEEDGRGWQDVLADRSVAGGGT